MNFSSFDFSSDFLEFQRSVAFVNSAYKQTYGAQLWPAVVIFSHIRHLISGENLRTLGSVTQSDQLGSERPSMNCFRTCLKIHRVTTKYHPGSYGSCQRVVCRKEWDIVKELWLPRHWLSALVYETMIFGPVLENGVTTSYECYI